MANSFLLPYHYQQAKAAKPRPARQWLSMFNEKHLILLLLVISIVTIFVILMNLPPDLQRAVRRESHHVFMPEVDYRAVKGSGDQLTHRDDHQHPAPPLYPDDKPKLEPSSSDTTSTPPSSQSTVVMSPLAAKNEYELNVTAKRNKIKEMALFGWKGYEKYAWGENELRPSSKIGHSAGIFGARPTKLGATIVDGLDTMYLMGYQEEYERGREWILKNLNINVDSEFSAFEMNIRFIGGLLSIYTLTEDKEFLIKAEEIATALLPIFDTPTGIPYALVNPVKKTCKNYNWASSSCSILAEFGTLSLEFQYLSDLTGNKIFAQKIDRIFQVLDNTTKEEGLYYNYMNPQTGKWCLKDASLGALADSFYEYLLKLWIYKNSPSENEKLLDTYLKAMDAAQQKMLLTSPVSNLVYFAEFKAGYRLDKKMDHLACFTGGLFGLTAKYVASLPESKRTHYMNLAKNITHTCHESYVRTPTHIGPESFHFERKEQEAVAVKNQEKYYILRPEVIESYFYMWRLTKEQKYRDWAWDAAMAIEKHCRTETGYAGLRDVYEPHPATDDVQQSFFFAETLKYLYLIFSDDHVLPLDKYVLNTEAHPFRIKN